MNYLKTFLPYVFGYKRGKSFSFPENLDWEKLSFEERLMFHTLRDDLDSFTSTLVISELSDLQIYHLFSFREHLPTDFLNDLIGHYPVQWNLFRSAVEGQELSQAQVQEILNYKTYRLSLVALFSKDRTKPGRLFIRKADGSFLHKADGHLFSVKVLGTSGRGLAFNHSNGATPAGVYSVDSVMPEANNQYEFGKHRRMKVNFLAKSPNEENIKQFLPATQHTQKWWLPSVVGRELGRSLLRIHGTGRVNKNPFGPHFPMIPSSGCLTTTERNFMGLVRFDDQRVLLDAIMEAMDLEPSFENESKIHGLLYVIEYGGTYQALEFKS